MNQVVLVGRLAQDAELRYTNSGYGVANFAIAVDRFWNGEKSTDFFDCVFMGKGAEKLSPHLSKGKQVGVQGELHLNKWEKDGKQMRKVEVFARNIELLGSKAKDDFKDDTPF